MDCSKSVQKSDADEGALPPFNQNQTAHCSAPSSSPQSSAVDSSYPFLPLDYEFNNQEKGGNDNDSYHSYNINEDTPSHARNDPCYFHECIPIRNQNFQGDISNNNEHDVCTPRSADDSSNNSKDVWNDVGQWQPGDYALPVRARISSSTDGGGGARSDICDLADSPVDSSKYEADVLEQISSSSSFNFNANKTLIDNDSNGNHPHHNNNNNNNNCDVQSTSAKVNRPIESEQQPQQRQPIDAPPASPPVVVPFTKRKYESVSDIEMSSSTLVSSLSPSSSVPRISRPTVFTCCVNASGASGEKPGDKNDNTSTKIDYDAYEDLPAPMLAKLLEQLNRQRWVVPVLPDQELEVLMEIAIRIIRKGLDQKARYFDSFMEKGLVVAYDKLMHDEAMKEWKLDIHRYIWQSVSRYFMMFIEKLKQKPRADEIHEAYWNILWQTMNCKNRFYMHNRNRSLESLQLSETELSEPQKYTRFSVNDQNDKIHVDSWIVVVLNRFGAMGGYEILKEYYKENVNEETNTVQLIEWLRPMASCAQLLSTDLIGDVCQHPVSIALKKLRSLTEKDLKCENVKGDLRESTIIELPRVIEALLSYNPSTADIGKEMFFFVLKYILRVLQVAPFAGRIAALEELHLILYNTSQCSIIPIDQVAQWLRANSTIEILFRDNLHNPAFVERLERVVRVLLEKDVLTADELDIMWDSQKGKHDAVQRNFNDLISKLANAFNVQLQERLFKRMKESWADSSAREKTLLLDLIRRIGIDFNENAEKALTLQSLSLLWDLFRDERLCVELMDAALDAHYSIIDSILRADDLRRNYIHKCIEELLADSVFVLPTLKHMQRLMMIGPDCTFSTPKNLSKNEFIETVQRDTELCSRLTANLTLYMGKVRNYVKNNPQMCSESEAGALMIDGRYTHEDHLRIRLSFLHFLLSEGQLWLMTAQANELWDALVVNAVFEFERTYGFKLFASMQEQEDIDPKALDPFFESRILKLPVHLLNEEGFCCFKIFWTSVNKRTGRLIQPPSSCHFSLNSFDLEGHDYLWEIILKARDRVSIHATQLWVDVFSNPHLDKLSDFGQLNEFVINKCFTMLKSNHDQLIRGDGDEFEKMGIINRMSRILFALHCYICAFDEDCVVHERYRQPLFYASLGQCFQLTVLFPVEQLQLLRKQMDTKISSSTFDLNSTNTSSNANEEEIFSVHSNMTASALKAMIEDRIRSWDGCCVDGTMARFQLGVQRASSVTDSSSKNDNNNMNINMSDMYNNTGNINSIATCANNNLSEDVKMLDAREYRRTLYELSIDESCQVVVKFSLSKWSTSRFVTSSDSSPDPSETMSGMCSDEEEHLLAGNTISSNSDYVRFLYTLEDIGFEYGSVELRDAASKVLNQIPADLLSMNIIFEMTTTNRLIDIMSSETPSRTLYLLRVLHSMLLPCDANLQPHAKQFQRTFFHSISCLAVFSFLNDPQVLHRWDALACIMALWWLINIAKFVLSVAVRVKNQILHQGNERERVPLGSDMIGGIYREYCDRIALDVCSGLDEGKRELRHLRSIFNIDAQLMDCLMRIVWAVGSRRIPLIVNSDRVNPPMNSSKEAIAASQQLCEMSKTQEDVTVVALECLGTASIGLNGTDIIATKLSMWSSIVVELLLCSSEKVRKHAVQIISRILSRPSVTERSLLVNTINVLFENIHLTEEKHEIASEYFTLLCKLLEYCRKTQVRLDNNLSRVDTVLEWLDSAKRHTAIHQESYPKDTLLIGYFDVGRCLVAMLPYEHKQFIGCDPNGKQFVRQIIDEYVLTSSRAFIDMERSREGSDFSHIQRSVTHSAISSRTGQGADQQQPQHSEQQPQQRSQQSNAMPRSASTVPISSNRCVPVCGSGMSTKSAYDLLMVLCDDSSANYFCMVDLLNQLFYSGPIPTMNIEWEYMPAFSLRTPNSYVGLKNGGATCYMNSVFQQIFMIEPLRAALLNANCPDEIDVDEGTDDRFMLFREFERKTPEQYHETMLKAVQSIFAHLLGSELQYYTPRFFWNHFRFYGQAVNVREQQDALEFYNALFDSIDEGLKKIGESPICEKLFGGTFADQKICKDCPHRYLREEAFTSISVDIRSHNNLLDSLKEYVKGDLLNNDNAYLCEECNKKVTAIKRLCVAKLPPYLTIQLKRFDFDWERDIPQKYNDYFEFPLELDMMPYTLAAEAESTKESTYTARSSSSVMDSGTGASIESQSEKYATDSAMIGGCVSTLDQKSSVDDSTQYRLRGVVVHSGQANGGHYYSFIRSDENDDRWYKFDDIDVTECILNKEEMRSTWFGGDYVSEAFDNSSNRYQKKRQKRWWSAYLLIYEKIGDPCIDSALCSSSEMIQSYSSTLQSQSHSPRSATSHSVSPVTVGTGGGIDKKFSAMSLSSRLRQLPRKLEAMIRGKNTRSMHERSQYTPQYFHFLREVTSRAVKMAERTTNKTEREKVCMVTIRLLSKFLFLTALRAKKTLRSGNLLEWQKTLESLFKMSASCRAWFVCNVMFQPKLIVMYLFVAPSADVRSFFVNILVAVMDSTRLDQIQSLRPYLGDCIDFKLDTICREGDTVSDVLITLMLIIARNNPADFSAHPSNYFDLFYLYAALGLEQKKQLVLKEALYYMLVMISRDDSRVKMIYQDTTKFYEIISSLLRTCIIDNDRAQLDKAAVNPYAVAKSGLLPMPTGIKMWMNDPVCVDRLLEQLLKLPSDYTVAVQTLLFLCWENLEFTVMALQHFSFETMFTPAEVKNAVEIFENLISINDSFKTKRLRVAMLGTEDRKYKGFIAQVLAQRDSSVFKPYKMCKSLIKIINANPEIYEMIVKERDACDSLLVLEDWLRRELNRNQNTYSYGCRPNEMKTSSGLDRTKSALDLLHSFDDISKRAVRDGGYGNDLDETNEPRAMDAASKSSNQNLSFENLSRSHQISSQGGATTSSDAAAAAVTPNHARSLSDTVMKLHAGTSTEDGDEDEGTDSDNMMITGSISLQDRLAATAHLKPPPYSEYGEQTLPAIPSDPRLSCGLMKKDHVGRVPVVSSRDISHSWKNNPTVNLSMNDSTVTNLNMQSPPSYNGSSNDDSDSVTDFISTGVENEDAPPAYDALSFGKRR